MLVETVKMVLNGVYPQGELDFLLAHKNGQSKVELRRAPPAVSSLVVLRVPAHESAHTTSAPKLDDVPSLTRLGRASYDNIVRKHWHEALREVVRPSNSNPETAP
jgi:hypothetical protein